MSMNRFSASTVVAACLASGMLAWPAHAEQAEDGGIKPGVSYAEARSHLLAQGWQPEGDRAGAGRPSGLGGQFPEVVCGSGRDAMCTGRFLRAGKAVIVAVDQNKKALPVTFIERD